MLITPQLHQLAFDNSSEANIISFTGSGEIIACNLSACRLLGYSKKQLLSKNINDIFKPATKRPGPLARKPQKNGSRGIVVSCLCKNGKRVQCKAVSTDFADSDGSHKSLTVFRDISAGLLEQKNIDILKDKIVADNISLAKSDQKVIDKEKKKVVADNILAAKEKQKGIDARKRNTVKVNINLAKSYQKIIDKEKEKVVADNILSAKAKQKLIDQTRKIKVVNNIKNAKIKQKGIDNRKEKIVADNIIVAQKKANSTLADNNRWIKHIAKTSYDVMWDWDITTGKIYVGDSIQEVFGYKPQNNTIKIKGVGRWLLPHDRAMVNKKLFNALDSRRKTWSDSFTIRRFDGSSASTKSRASIVRDKAGKAIRMIGATQDVTRLQHLENKVAEQVAIQKELSKIFRVAGELSFDGVWDWNLVTKEFFLGKGFRELFGYGVKSRKGNQAANWSNYLHPADKKEVEESLKAAIASADTHWEHSYRFIRSDGSIATVFNRASIIRDVTGEAYRIIGAMQDISKQNVLEEKLAKEIRLREKQIEEAATEARMTERSDIGRELHDNVNQLLGASRLYLNMAKQGGRDSEMYISRSSEYTLTAIEEIRKLTRLFTATGINTPRLCDSIGKLCNDTMEAHSIKISVDCAENIETSMDNKFKQDIFRIIQEHLSNILKHAHATKVAIQLLQNKLSISLSILDNGIGFDTAKKRSGIGIANIKSRAISNHGAANFISGPGEGCKLKVKFPIAEMILNKN